MDSRASDPDPAVDMDTNERTAEEGEEGEAREGASSSSTHPKRILALWSIAVVLFIVSSVYTLDESQRALLVYRLGPSRAALQAALEGIVRRVDVDQQSGTHALLARHDSIVSR